MAKTPKRPRGAKRVHVKKYPSWRGGKRLQIGEHNRGDDPKLSVRKTKAQLRLDLGDEERE